ncbi:MAG: DUF2085 domain-containing protein [Candidatus Villigracilaceae bacterium]
MQKTVTAKRVTCLTRWLIPLAAILVTVAWLFIAPPGLLGKADAIGYAVCHRIDARSFHIGERQLPLCVRCTGTFTAAMVGIILQALIGRHRAGFPTRKAIAVLGIFALAFALDGSNSYLALVKQTIPGRFEHIPNLYTPQHWLRLLTGSGMGLGMAAAIFPIFNQTLYKTPDLRPVLEGWRQLGLLVGSMFFLDLAILSEQPFILYPIAFISVSGVIMLLTMIFSMLWVMLMRQENTYESLRHAWLPLLAGFTIAMLMILSIDLVRLSVTGTWGAIPLGHP